MCAGASRRTSRRFDATSVARLSRITVTLICPGYSRWSSISRAISCESRIAVSSSTSSGLTMTRISQPAEDLHELLVEVAAVRLEDRLLARLADVVLELRLRLVVHLLDAGRVDAPVLDQLHERQLRRLTADAVERRQDDGLRRVVDDEVDAGEMLEGANVAALAADDPALHVVGRELDERDGRLRGV